MKLIFVLSIIDPPGLVYQIRLGRQLTSTSPPFGIIEIAKLIPADASGISGQKS